MSKLWKKITKGPKKYIMELTMLIVNRQTMHFGSTTPVNRIILWILLIKSIINFLLKEIFELRLIRLLATETVVRVKDPQSDGDWLCNTMGNGSNICYTKYRDSLFKKGFVVKINNTHPIINSIKTTLKYWFNMFSWLCGRILAHGTNTNITCWRKSKL